MLLNLLSNAIKFVSGGVVIVDVNIISEDGGNQMLKLSVTDKGLGISEEDQATLF